MATLTSSASTQRRAPALSARGNQLDATALVCKAAGDGLRLQILQVLQNDAFGVLELSRIFVMPQPGLSHHLKILANAGLVATRREGTCVFYRRALGGNENSCELRDALFAQLDRCALPRSIAARVQQVQLARAESSRAFFRRHADKFRAQQDLIAGYDQYGATVVEFIDAILPNGGGNALEVGPGEGELLIELARRFSTVTAIDNAQEMLSRSRLLTEQHRLANISFVHGDATAARQTGAKFNLITLNMVLHHTSSPSSVIAGLAALLKPGGSLVITDLCDHDQDWARSACGDMWLGFEPGQLTQWAQIHGLADGESLHVALRNGFRVQLRQFYNPASGQITSGDSLHE